MDINSFKNVDYGKENRLMKLMNETKSIGAFEYNGNRYIGNIVSIIKDFLKKDLDMDFSDYLRIDAINWLKKNKQFLSINAIDEYMHENYGVPNTTVTKAVNGSQNLPKKWEKPLNEFLDKLKNQDK